MKHAYNFCKKIDFIIQIYNYVSLSKIGLQIGDWYWNFGAVDQVSGMMEKSWCGGSSFWYNEKGVDM